ncbi:hypothetical protein FDECE_5991 [Fusarium decemcellulare]|nr:hypothetical protein FDECE_5991 [Fusarium decemcellulare]
MKKLRKEVSAGLSNLLGPDHPLALEAQPEAAYSLLFNGDLREAHKQYAELFKRQRKVGGDKDPSPYFTLVFRAQAEYLSSDSKAALSTLSQALEGFNRTTGPESNGALVVQLWYAIVDTSVGHTDKSIRTMQRVRDERKKQYGLEDSFGIAAQLFLGDLYRRPGEKEQALTSIKPGLEFRRGFWPISHFLTLDTALVLSIAYRDFGEHDAAIEIIEEIEGHANLGEEENFVRLCQVKHLKSLLLFDRGYLDEPISLLSALLIKTSRESNNRAPQWVRLGLAFMMRYRVKEDDERLASSLFDGIVKARLADEGEPSPPRFPQAAEKALRLVRDGESVEADDLLRRENLRWTHEEDLWMWLGVLPADTGRMKPPKGLNDGADNLSG